MGIKTVSYSALDTYQRCPYKYHLAYNERLTRGEVEVSPATMGVAIHAGLSYGLLLYHMGNYTMTFEELYEHLEDFYSLWAEQNVPDEKNELDEYGDVQVLRSHIDDFYFMVEESRQIVYRTFVHLDVPNNWRTVELDGVPLIEYRGEVPLTFTNDDNINLVFVIDWVAQDIHTGLQYVVDWKSRRNFQEDETETLISGEDFNTQITLYQGALWKLGIKTHGTITYQIAPYVPKIPVRLQNSVRFSKSNIKTDWDTYAETLIQGGENPHDEYYADMKEKLGNMKWWQPVTIFRTPEEIANRWQTAKKWALRIHTDGIHPKTESVMCRFCPYNQICIAEDRGFDTDIIKRMEYLVRQSTMTESELLSAV